MDGLESEMFRNLYLHVPFCSGKCVYCGFYSELYVPERADMYLDALEMEIGTATAASRPAANTLYIGGGTPSVLTAAQWRRLCGILQRHFDCGLLSEWTVEANPGTVSEETAAVWLEYGVSRISLGAQSMCDTTLARMDRRHNAGQTAETVRFLRKAGFRRIGLDLIACLPGVTPAEWRDTLQAVVDLAPEHISVYACGIEQGSRLEQWWRRGLYSPLGERDEQEALDVAAGLLARQGFEHYEISNFALPGERCRYNLKVWQGDDYVGFGPAAASRAGLERWVNRPDLNAYCARQHDGIPPREQETVTPSADAAERLIFNFRLSDAVDLDEFAVRHGAAARRMLPFWTSRLAELARHGLVACGEDGGWRCTPQGSRLADAIAEALLPDSE